MTTPWILGLTGGIGSGKSAVAQHFIDLGVHCVDADHAARWVVEPEQTGASHYRRALRPAGVAGQWRAGPHGTARSCFQAPEERRWLEALLHPLIGEEIMASLASATSPYAILVSPLLIESGQYKLTQRVLVVDAPSLQLERTMLRDSATQEQVHAILKAQALREDRLKHADDVLLNDRDLPWLHSEVERLHRFYLTLHGGQP